MSGTLRPEGADQPTCGARTAKTGHPCNLKPVPGGKRCYRHGGKAEQRMLERRAALDAAGIIGHKSYISDRQAIHEALAEATGNIETFREALRALASGDEALIAEAQPAFRVVGMTDDPATLAQRLLDAYDTERDRQVQIASVAIKWGLFERKVANDERVSAALVAYIDRIINDDGLALTAEQRARAHDLAIIELGA